MASYRHDGILKGKTFSFIAVDNFFEDVVLRASVFFLTHYHSDHYEGLRNQCDAEKVGDIFRKNPEKLLYCSDITKRIFESNRGKTCFIPERQIISQPIGHPFNIFGPKSPNSEDGIIVTVTFVPSGHILGAVMILFEHENERVLFTGDFRISPGDIPKVKALHDSEGDVKTLTHLYLDTTFAKKSYSSFPLRNEISKFVSEIIDDWLCLSERNKVHLNLPYLFAYERLMIDISRYLKCKILVSSEAYEMYFRYIPELDDAVTPGTEDFDRSKYRVHACVDMKCYEDYILNWCEFCPVDKCNVRIIRPCAMYFDKSKDYKSLYENHKSGIIRVPYSTHCSLEELQSFVKHMNPKKITTICRNIDEFKNNILPLVQKPVDSTDFGVSFGNTSEQVSSVFEFKESYCDFSDDCSSLGSPPR